MRTAPAYAVMWLDGDLDCLRSAPGAKHAHFLVDEAHEMLHPIQNGFNLQLNGWSPRWMNLFLFNCRLIQPAGNQLFFFAGCLAHRCRFGQALFTSPCDASCSAPTSELYHQVKFPQAVALLCQWRGVEPVLQEATRFYRMQLHRHNEAFAYLYQRGIRSAALLEEMRIGYAPGGCLRGWLTQLGHSLPALCQTGLVTEAGYDAYVRRIVFPLEGNLYGRSLSDSAPAHRFLPGAKGGLYLWEQVQSYPEVILVEGLFDYAAVWQAGFQNVTCSLGAHLNTRQFRQLCDGPRTVYLAFDADPNGSGQQAAQSLAGRLREQGVNARRVSLPEGYDPNSFFVGGGGNAQEFHRLLEEACL